VTTVGEWRYFIAYGGWSDSVTGENFVLCRYIQRRGEQWAKHLMPKLHKHLKMWYGVKMGDWWVDNIGNPPTLGDDGVPVMWRNYKHTCYEWTGTDWRMVAPSERVVNR
jgi:hypothetical protein